MRQTALPSDEEARREILEVGRRMYAKNFVAANDGNISCRVADGCVWATPTGVSKGFMTEDILVKLRLDGTVVQAGPLKASSEIKMHLRIYDENPAAGAVVHAHPPVSTAFAVAGLALDAATYPEALVNLGVVPCVHYEAPGSQGIPDSVAPYARDYNAVLLANHGAVCWGAKLMEAFYRLEALEHYALITLYTDYIIGQARTLCGEQMAEVLRLRQVWGVSGGGVPRALAPEAQNLADVVHNPPRRRPARRAPRRR